MNEGNTLIEMAGQRIGFLEVTRVATNEEKKSCAYIARHDSGAFWVCKCHNCGNENYIAPGGILRHRAKRNNASGIACGCLPRGRGSKYKYRDFESKAAADLFANARDRARSKGLIFDLSPSDIHIPKKCPLLPWIQLHKGNKKMHDGSPTLDRIDSKKGYTKGNVWVISWRANNLKSNAEPEELLALGRNLWETLHPPIAGTRGAY